MKLSEVLAVTNNIEDIDLSKVMLCEVCKNVFVWYDNHFDNLPNLCPTCLDKKQKRPSIVQERTVLKEWSGVEIASLPTGWTVTEPEYHSDFPCHKMVLKGKAFGASWSGRIDIFADAEYSVGDVVDVRIMQSRHLIKQMSKVVGHVQNSPYAPLSHLVVKTVPLQTNESLTENAKFERVIEERNYIVLNRSEESAQYRLVWATAYSKTTLKGYGRQFHASISTDTCLWHQACSGGVRSGRAHTEGVLAIVDEKHPLIKKFREGGEETVSYIS